MRNDFRRVGGYLRLAKTEMACSAQMHEVNLIGTPTPTYLEEKLMDHDPTKAQKVTYVAEIPSEEKPGVGQFRPPLRKRRWRAPRDITPGSLPERKRTSAGKDFVEGL